MVRRNLALTDFLAPHAGGRLYFGEDYHTESMRVAAVKPTGSDVSPVYLERERRIVRLRVRDALQTDLREKMFPSILKTSKVVLQPGHRS